MTHSHAAPHEVGSASPSGARRPSLDALQQHLGTRLLGKPHPIRLTLTCLLAGGHLLIEDVPGVGKTTLAHAVAHVCALSFARIQFTSDLLPSDILGTSIYDRNSGLFHFHAGPIFSQLVLADEINRASPKTQSALLEAMAERQVTIEGETRTLQAPFTVIATQNPSDQGGTFALPDSQLDRFFMCITLGYPPAAAERELLATGTQPASTQPLSALAEAADLIAWQQTVDTIHTSDALLDYVLRLLQASRSHAAFRHGLSPRAGLALRRAAQAWALLAGRDYVLPADVQSILPAVVNHRLHTTQTQPAAELLLSLVDAD